MSNWRQAAEAARVDIGAALSGPARAEAALDRLFSAAVQLDRAIKAIEADQTAEAEASQ